MPVAQNNPPRQRTCQPRKTIRRDKEHASRAKQSTEARMVGTQQSAEAKNMPSAHNNPPRQRICQPQGAF
jgi:hypothetical protein